MSENAPLRTNDSRKVNGSSTAPSRVHCEAATRGTAYALSMARPVVSCALRMNSMDELPKMLPHVLWTWRYTMKPSYAMRPRVESHIQLLDPVELLLKSTTASPADGTSCLTVG